MLVMWDFKLCANQSSGTADANYDIGDTGQFPDKPPLAAIGSVAIGIAKLVASTVTFVPGKKDIAPSLYDSRTIQERIVAAADWTVLFYDILTRQAWLLNGPSALLHICRAWLSSERAELLCTASPADPISVFQHAHPQGGLKEAIRLLLCTANRDIKLWAEDQKPTIESSIEVFTNHRKVEKKMSASWVTWGDLVQGRVLALELLHDHLVEKRSARETNVRTRFREQRLEGYDFQEIMKLNRKPQTWEVHLQSSFGGWLDFANSINAIPIFGARFGDMLSPTSATIIGMPPCGQRTPLPTDKDYLAVSMEVLHRLCKEHLKRLGNGTDHHHYLQLGHSTFWREPGAAFAPCTCDQHACQIQIAILSPEPGRSSNSISLNELFARNSHGAVILPCQSNRVRKSQTHARQPMGNPVAAFSNTLKDNAQTHFQETSSWSDGRYPYADVKPPDGAHALVQKSSQENYDKDGDRNMFERISDSDKLLMPPTWRVDVGSFGEPVHGASNSTTHSGSRGELTMGEEQTSGFPSTKTGSVSDFADRPKETSFSQPRPLRKRAGKRKLHE